MNRLLGVFTLFSLSMAASTINLNTGVAGWTGTGPNTSGTVPAVSLGSTPNPYWLPAPGGSAWVSTTATDGLIPEQPTGIPGTYTFTLEFDTNSLGGSLSYVAAADNSVTLQVFLDGLLLNTFAHPGNALSTGGAPGCAFLPVGSNMCGGSPQGLVGPGTITWGAGGLGEVTIVATVTNSEPPSPSPVGLLLVGSADVREAASDIPEPSTYVMVGMGLIATRLSRKRPA